MYIPNALDALVVVEAARDVGAAWFLNHSLADKAGPAQPPPIRRQGAPRQRRVFRNTPQFEFWHCEFAQGRSDTSHYYHYVNLREPNAC